MIEIAADSWLAGILERPVHRVTGSVAVDDEASRLRLQELAAQSGFSYARVPTADMHSLDAFQAAGFRVVDTGITLDASSAPERAQVDSTGHPYATVRLARAEDASAVERIARAGFALSRFHLDPRIAPTLADEVKAQWAANFFRGKRGDYMVVAERGGEVAGFLQLLAEPHGLLVIDLIAVGAAHRKRGLAGAMICHAGQHCGRVARMRVGTQAANLDSLRLYQKLGFLISATAYVVHCHGPVAAS